MPDLSTETVHAFWHEYDPNILYKIVCSFEESETWIQYDEKTQTLVSDLGDVLDKVANFDFLQQETLIELLTILKFSQALRVMQFMETKTPGIIARLLMWADEKKRDRQSNQRIDAFLRRNLIFERLQLLARVFSKERLDLLSKSVEHISANS